MSLSFSKLEKLLVNNGFAIRKIFTIDNYCVYIELLCNSTADVIMLYIPSKYNIKSPSLDITWPLTYIDIDESGDIPESYTEEKDNFDLEQQYDEVTMNIEINLDKQKNIEDHLEESYNHPVSLKDINKSDKTVLREIFRQLRRLKFCVQNVKYKLCIIYHTYICCLRRDETFECFYVKGQKFPQKNRKLVITFDLETLYNKLDSISIDVKTIKEGIYKVLDKNHLKNTHSLFSILQFKETLINSAEKYTKKKQEFTQYIMKFEKLLQDMNLAEQQTLEKLSKLDKQYGHDNSIKGLHSDIEKSHIKSKYETDIDNIDRLKKEITTKILDIKLQRETLSLQIDKICFDNIVMLDSVRKNFELLSKI